MASERALICGATGQDGAYLARALLDRGIEVHGTSRQPALPEGNLAAVGAAGALTPHVMEPASQDSVRAVLGEVRPDRIFYLAAQSSVARSFDEPVETWRAAALGLVHVLEAAREIVPEARILNAGSGDCFGERPAHAPADETTAFAPRSPYAAAKCAAHHAVAVARRAHGQFASTAFLFSHESPLRPETFAIGKIVGAVKRIAAGSGELLELGNVEVVRDWGWAPEYVEAMVRMLALDAPRDLVIATGRSHSLAEFVAAAFAEAGLDWRDHVRIGAVAPRPADIACQHADPGLARELLGWRAETGLAALARRLIGG